MGTVFIPVDFAQGFFFFFFQRRDSAGCTIRTACKPPFLSRLAACGHSRLKPQYQGQKRHMYGSGASARASQQSAKPTTQLKAAKSGPMNFFLYCDMPFKTQSPLRHSKTWGFFLLHLLRNRYVRNLLRSGQWSFCRTCPCMYIGIN